MTTRTKKILQYTFFLALGLGLTIYVFSGQDLSGLWEKIRQANYGYIALGLLLTLFGHVSRAMRWRILVQNSGHKARLPSTFASLMTGYFVNLGIPRLGEITRCGMLYRLDKVPFMASAGTVILARAIDLLTLTLLVLFTWWTGSAELNDFFQESIFEPVGDLFAGKKALLVIGIAFMAVLGSVAGYVLLFRRHWLMERRFAKFLLQMTAGLRSVFQLRRLGAFLLHTLIIWLSYFSAPLFTLLALGYSPPNIIALAFAVFTIGGIARTIPVPAGSIGAYHWLVAKLLIVFGFSWEEGLAVATLNHAAQTVFYLIAGLAGVLMYYWMARRAEADRSLNAS